MTALLDLQKSIENLKTESGIQLVEVCNKPLSPSSEACNIQNIWAYWQDDMSNFEAKGIDKKSGHLDTYLDHFLLCARNPTLQQDQTAMAQPCMSKGGIPVQPFFALGGFPGKEYRGNKLCFFIDCQRIPEAAYLCMPCMPGHTLTFENCQSKMQKNAKIWIWGSNFAHF